jgi:pimeloyl-ACP methyl ester carboxylesterase
MRRRLDARPDTLDFRDRMFEPTLVEVPTSRPLDDYRAARVPILDQGQEGACTGFGLATVIHYLLRTRKVVPDRQNVSPWMIYEMARRYDEWPGEHYEGSSARGAMKGWHKHGVCSATHWAKDGGDMERTPIRFAEALRRPLGAYLRVNHKDLTAMHSAITEVGVLYTTATVHDGWDTVGKDGIIRYDASSTMTGGHAFAIVAYDQQGFWIQNSWGRGWGHAGFGFVSYDDWLANGTDVWVARLGAPIEFRSHTSVSRGVGVTAGGTRGYMFSDLRPHILSLGNNGLLRTDGTYGTSADDVKEIFNLVAGQAKQRPHLLLYAHGGLTAEDSAIQKIADLRGPLLDAGVYPISFIWKTDFWTTLKNILEDSIAKRRPEGFVDSSKDFMLDRLDDALEPLARVIGGKAEWDEMKENAIAASETGGGLALVADLLAGLTRRFPSLKIHVVGHSAGSILLGGLAARLASDGAKPVRIETCTLWAPACTVDLYRADYLPSLRDGMIKHFAVFTLTDKAERDDTCANIYHKSLLYLVSNAFEASIQKAPFFKERAGVPILGMAKFISALPAVQRSWDWVRAPNANAAGHRDASAAKAHGAFDDDAATLRATIARVLGKAQMTAGTFSHHPSAAANRAVRAALNATTAG